MNKKNISIVAQEFFSTIEGNLESIISLFPLQYKKQYDAISYVINNLNNIRIQPQESQSLINELEEELTEITELTNTELLKVYENNLKDQERLKTAEDKKALEEYLEKKYALLLNAKNSEEEKQEIIAKYKKEVESLNKENRQNLQSQEHDQRTGKEITNIEEHKLVKAGIVTQEEIAPYLSHYELLNTLGEYSSITEDENEGISLVKKLFEAARNFYENNPAQGLQELMEISHQKASDLLGNNILLMLENKQISFIEVNYIEASELDKIDNIEIKPHYKLLECIIVSGCPLTLQKLINDNKTSNSNGDTLLHLAVLHDNLEIVKELLNHSKFDVNAKNSDGVTPLHFTGEYLKKCVKLKKNI